MVTLKSERAQHAAPLQKQFPGIARQMVTRSIAFNRRSIRLSNYDYANDGAYFVTICTHDRLNFFGAIEGAVIHLNVYGLTALERWNAIPNHFVHVQLDAFVVMPNHIHVIIMIERPETPASQYLTSVNPVGAQHAAPETGVHRPFHVKSGSLGAIVRSYKSAVTRSINIQRATPGAKVWQHNYFEHIIRDEKSLRAVRTYIHDNPAHWQADSEYLA